jgi:hypothetical protein
MNRFQVAHLKIHNVDVVIIFLNERFDHLSDAEQSRAHGELQLASHSAGLRGNTVLVWNDAFGRMKFRAPRNQQVFFQSVSYMYLYSQVNRTLTCAA